MENPWDFSASKVTMAQDSTITTIYTNVLKRMNGNGVGNLNLRMIKNKLEAFKLRGGWGKCYPHEVR